MQGPNLGAFAIAGAENSAARTTAMANTIDADRLSDNTRMACDSAVLAIQAQMAHLHPVLKSLGINRSSPFR
jgi:hypothetical protein